MVDRRWLSKIDVERLDKPFKARKALEVNPVGAYLTLTHERNRHVQQRSLANSPS